MKINDLDRHFMRRKPSFLNANAAKFKFQEKELKGYLSKPRPSHSFIYIATEKAIFTLPGGKKYTFNQNSLIYIPKGLKYSAIFVGTSSKDYTCLQAFFHFTDRLGKEYAFDKFPAIVLEETPEQIINLFLELVEESINSGHSFFKKQRLFFQMMEMISKKLCLNEINCNSSSVVPAIYYISVHLNENISITKLAKFCMMSESAFRREFINATGMPPSQYKITLKIDKAKEFIKNDPYISSQSLAELLAFSDVAHFYKTFKRIEGCSLKQFKNSLKY